MDEFYLDIMKEELIPAFGCTEPIAIAYASAKARDVLGCMPESIEVECSGNIIKNVKSVIVPGTKNMKGVDTSAVLGIVGGNADKVLEVLSEINEKHLEITKTILEKKTCKVKLAKGVENLYIKVSVVKGEKQATVTIADSHTNIIEITKNGKVLFKSDKKADKKIESNAIYRDRSKMSIEGIYKFINNVDVKKLEKVLEKQIELNVKIAKEGLKNNYGVNVGRTLIKMNGEQVANLAKAYAASGSDARMSGCELPVVINSGSGNQGLTVSLPVIVYAKQLKAPKEKLYRALALSNLVSIHIKSGIGKLSAFCGAVSAAAGAGAAIAYLNDGSYKVISDTIINTLADVSGIVCDGAKPSCAAKIASAVDSAIMGYQMAAQGSVFNPGEGLIKDDIEKTLKSICRMAKEGMKETDIEILTIMNEG
ncbi:serine dehydratase subunit alpha family protein [Clostridium sp.]|jgi:L-cysteine desulfidase|uniref:L-cysteine desulfidase family protein n=1 Tax=Clostridium sp. TaxID=1506 RepID=UPI003A1F20E2